MAFVDTVRVRVRAGRGGRGAATFRTEPFVPRGGPDGGDGGDGGSIQFVASASVADLSPFSRRSRLQAEDGSPGAGGRKGGRDGADLLVKVPVGTAVYDDETGDLIADLAEPEARAVVAAGGAGGEGNLHRATAVNRAPSTAGPGAPGEERTLRLELSIPADIVLLGPPNGGRSELLAALTNARPKVAPYPYTTTAPEPGVIFTEFGEPVLLLEVPAGPPGRRHLERARGVVIVADGRQPGDLDPYRELAGDRPVLIVFTHADAAPPPPPAGVRLVSGFTGEGLEELRQDLLRLARTAPARPARRPLRRTRLAAAEPSASVRVERRGDGWTVLGGAVERLLDRYDVHTPEGFDRFQVGLDRAGVSSALAEAGVQPGDTVRVGDAEFEYQP